MEYKVIFSKLIKWKANFNKLPDIVPKNDTLIGQTLMPSTGNEVKQFNYLRQGTSMKDYLSYVSENRQQYTYHFKV